jgi:hypothetical protein
VSVEGKCFGPLENIALPRSINIGSVNEGLMNRTTAGMRSKTTSKSRIHFFPRPREAKPFTRYFELCECDEFAIILRLTADSMIFLRAIPYPAVALAKEDVQCAAHIFVP